MKTASLLTLALLASLAAAAPAWADSGDYDNARVQVDNNQVRTNNFHNTGSVYQPTPDTFSYSGPFGTHYSLTEPGLTTATVHVAVPVYINAVPSSAKRMVSALNTSWYDNLTINNAAYTGQTGTMTFDVRFDGDITWSGENGLLFMEDRFYVNGNLAVDLSGISYYEGHTGLQNYDYFNGAWSHHQTYTVNTSFVYGQPISLGEDAIFWSENTNYHSQSGGYGNYDGTFTTAWNGNLHVTAPNSSPDTSFTPSSSSGTDYSVPMAAPEPSQMALLVFGAAGLVMRRHRRN